MCNWRAWLLPGFVTVAVITALAIILRGGVIEEDISSRAASLFQTDGVPWAATSLDGRDMTLSGTAPTEASFHAAVQAANRVWGVRTVSSDTLTLLPLADPYTLSFERAGDTLTASGAFPNAELRTDFLDDLRAELPDIAIDDQTELARGAPSDWVDQITFLAPSLTTLSPVSVWLQGGDLTVEGDAPTLEAYDIELARLADLPRDFSSASITINPPIIAPYIWEAATGEGGVTLSGFAPDDDARGSLVDAASRLGAVYDQMERGFGAPEGFVAAATALLGQMASLENASATIEDRALSLSGEAVDHTAYDSTNMFLGSLPEGFDSLSGRIAPPLADPFQTSMVWDGTAMSLSGALPDETSRAVFANALETAGVELSDRARVSRAAPEGIDMPTLLETLAETLTSLAQGEAALSGDTLSVEGIATSFDSAASAELELSALSSDVLAVTASITPGPASPYIFNVAVDDERLILSGFAPSDEVRTSLLSDLAILFPGAAIGGDIAIADGAPDSFVAMVAAGLRGLSRLANGALMISDKQAELTGDALYRRSVSVIESSVAAPDGFNLSTDIGALPLPAIVDAATCQARLEETLGAATILFETGSASIDGLSLGLLDRLVRTLQSCPAADVEIGGHTDSRGADNANQTLSEARATSVLDYMTGVGVRASRITAVGYGESQPIADNATEEGRAQNRRITFTVQQ